MRWLRGLDPRLPREVQLLQLGGLANAFGNGVVLPFMLIYLHNVQGISLGTAGLIRAEHVVPAGRSPSEWRATWGASANPSRGMHPRERYA